METALVVGSNCMVPMCGELGRALGIEWADAPWQHRGGFIAASGEHGSADGPRGASK